MSYISVCFAALFILVSGAMASSDIGPPGPNEVLIGPNVIMMPAGRILLVQKDNEYCAIKFIEFWTKNSDKDRYAKYESYYRKDKSFNKFDNNVIIHKDTLVSLYPKWSLFGHPVVLFGDNKEIKCSDLKLWWSVNGTVYFFKSGQRQGDYGIGLAPTPWTDISQINISNPNIIWYRYDGKRKDRNIVIDELWQQKGIK